MKPAKPSKSRANTQRRPPPPPAQPPATSPAQSQTKRSAKTIDYQLTNDQKKVLQYKLPPGYSLIRLRPASSTAPLVRRGKIDSSSQQLKYTHYTKKKEMRRSLLQKMKAQMQIEEEMKRKSKGSTKSKGDGKGVNFDLDSEDEYQPVFSNSDSYDNDRPDMHTEPLSIDLSEHRETASAREVVIDTQTDSLKAAKKEKINKEGCKNGQRIVSELVLEVSAPKHSSEEEEGEQEEESDWKVKIPRKQTGYEESEDEESEDSNEQEHVEPIRPPKKVRAEEVERKFSCELAILEGLKKCKNIDPFMRPVDEEEDGAPDYYETIARPIDLRTIEEKLRGNSYSKGSEVHADIRRMWANAKKYNFENKFMLKLTTSLEKEYQKLLRNYSPNTQGKSKQKKVK